MNPTYEPLVTQVGVDPASERGSSDAAASSVSDCQSLTERDEAPGTAASRCRSDVIAAAALLG